VDLDARLLTKCGKKIRVPEQSFKILALLITSPGELVTRETLRAELWPPNTFVDFDRGLTIAVNRLRTVLGDSADKPRYIETAPRLGYRFIDEVHREYAEGLESWGRKNDTNILPDPEKSANPDITPVPTISAKGVDQNKNYVSMLALGAALVACLAVLIHELPRRPPLTNSDLVLIADTFNRTGDQVFDDSLKQAITTELTQSPFLNILSDAKIGPMLELMKQPPGARLTGEIARDLCQRAGAKVYVAGSITTLASQYVVGLEAITCKTGDLLAKEQEIASGRDGVLKAVDLAGNRFRKKLGESLASVQKFDAPLEQATTSSLEALRSYSMGNRTRSDAEAIPLFKRALELDPQFALAYDGVGISYSNINEPGLAAENIEKAYQLRQRVSERERMRITADYFQVVTGELEKANQTCQLWAQVFPQDHYPHNLLGVNYEFLGKYEQAVSEMLEAVRLNPESSFLYSNLMEDYSALGRLDDAKKAYQQAMELKRDQVFLHADRYGIAFLEQDLQEMDRQVAWANGRAGAEDWLLSNARELSQRAADSALHSDEKEQAALWYMNAALRDAETGYFSDARRQTKAALKIAATRDVKILAALALARSGKITEPKRMADDLAQQFPLNTVVNSYWLPTIRASIELNRADAAKAIDILKSTANYEWGGPNPEMQTGRFLYPAYVRGQAYLRIHKGTEAIVEFRKILDHPGIVQNCILGALAHVGIARAYAMRGDRALANASYSHILELWKSADGHIPILTQVVNERRKLQTSDAAK
jgi:DNA-binding winged helix-turn-helix (wHTH) protein/tetratricopeptide (TPR) repeat protein